MRTPFTLLILLFFAPATQAADGMVVTVSPPATDVGVDILQAGGNAVDASVAVGFALAVTWPEAGNIGGGGFMLIHRGGKEKPAFIDYRETAPAAATRDMFAKGVDYQSAKTAGVPGAVRGYGLAHKLYGKLPWKDLVWPAVKLAEEGFPVNAALAGRLNGVLADPKTTNAEFLRIFGKKDRWKAGDVLKQPDLGRTLRLIAEKGPDTFYSGVLADKIVAEMKASGGLVTLADLKGYKAENRTPLRGTYRGYEVIGAPPPSSGGTALITALNILELYDLKKNPWRSAETTHLVAEAMRRAFADRALYLGDPDFTKVPENLLTKDHAKELAKTIDPAKATQSELLAPEIDIAPDKKETTHFSIVDGDGMAVANTTTLENSFGCRVVVRGAGFLLNNELTDFNPKPGVTTRTGPIGTDANLVAPGKRPLSSMTPTILLRDGKLALVTGSPGGRTIINTVLCVVLNFVDYGHGIQAAVDAPRMHHQWFPDRIALEDFPGRAQLDEKLQALGHTVVTHPQGDAHSIAVDPKTGKLVGAADKRLDGKAKGLTALPANRTEQFFKSKP